MFEFTHLQSLLIVMTLCEAISVSPFVWPCQSQWPSDGHRNLRLYEMTPIWIGKHGSG